MASNKSNYLENKVLDHVLKNTAFTQPANLYLALYTSDPGETDAGTEVTGGSYARQTVAFGAASGGSASNSGAVSFSGMPAATVTHLGIRDASSGGNLLYYAALTTPLTVTSGSIVNFAIGAITVSEL